MEQFVKIYTNSGSVKAVPVKVHPDSVESLKLMPFEEMANEDRLLHDQGHASAGAARSPDQNSKSRISLFVPSDERPNAADVEEEEEEEEGVIEPPGLAAKLMSDWGLSSKRQSSQMLDSQILENSKEAIEEAKKDSEWDMVGEDGDEDYDMGDEPLYLKSARKVPPQSLRADPFAVSKAKALLTGPKRLLTDSIAQLRRQPVRRGSDAELLLTKTATEQSADDDDFELVEIPSPALHEGADLPLRFIPPRKSSYRHTSACKAGIDQCEDAIQDAETAAAINAGMPYVALTNSETNLVMQEHFHPLPEHLTKVVHQQGEIKRTYKYLDIECDETCPNKSFAEKMGIAVTKATRTAEELWDMARAKIEQRGTITREG